MAARALFAIRINESLALRSKLTRVMLTSVSVGKRNLLFFFHQKSLKWALGGGEGALHYWWVRVLYLFKRRGWRESWTSKKNVDYWSKNFRFFWTDISVHVFHKKICVTVLTLAHTCVTLPKCEKVWASVSKCEGGKITPPCLTVTIICIVPSTLSFINPTRSVNIGIMVTSWWPMASASKWGQLAI